MYSHVHQMKKRNLFVKWVFYLSSHYPWGFNTPLLRKQKLKKGRGLVLNCHAMHVFICHFFVRWKEKFNKWSGQPHLLCTFHPHPTLSKENMWGKFIMACMYLCEGLLSYTKKTILLYNPVWNCVQLPTCQKTLSLIYFHKNIHTHPREGRWKFRMLGFSKAKP